MLTSFYISARTKRRILTSLASVATTALLLSFLSVVAGNVLLRKSVAALIEQAESRYGVPVTVEKSRYSPPRGISLEGVVFDGLFDGSSVRIKIPPLAALRLRDYAGTPLPRLKPWNAIHVLWRVLGEARAAGVLPRRIDIRGISIDYNLGDHPLTLAVEHLSVEHDPGAAAVTVTIVATGTPAIRANLRVGYKERSLSGTLDLAGIALATTPFAEGELSGSMSYEADGAGTLEFGGDVFLNDLSVNLPSVAEEAISPLDVHYQFAGQLDPHVSLPPVYLHQTGTPAGEAPRGTLAISYGDLTVNQVRMSLAPTFRGLFGVSLSTPTDPLPSAPNVASTVASTGAAKRPGLLDIHVVLPDTPTQQILNSIPEAVGGALTSMKLDGSMRWEFELQVQLDEISEMEWTSNTVLTDFAVREISPAYNVYGINDEFVHTIVDESIDFRRTVMIPTARDATMEWMLTHSEHYATEIEEWRSEAEAVAAGRPPAVESPAVGGDEPAVSDLPDPDPTYRYVYLDDMSPWVTRAVLTAEDGDFFFYGGVNPVTLADAIERNVEAGEIVFGASTISMQLAKMLFLDQKRIFSRKLQEIFLVYLMEHHVPVAKDRILELYINLAEFGPGVFGIHHASTYYFAKHPRDLSAGEAAWLASILPAPKTYHRYFENRWISDGWFIRMVSLFDIMLVRGRMTQEEYDEAVTQRPVFTE